MGAPRRPARHVYDVTGSRDDTLSEVPGGLEKSRGAAKMGGSSTSTI